MATRAPSAANSFAVARPMPLLPPVISAVLFASLIGKPRQVSGMMIVIQKITGIIQSVKQPRRG